MAARGGFKIYPAVPDGWGSRGLWPGAIVIYLEGIEQLCDWPKPWLC